MISTEFLMIKVNNISVQNKLSLFYWSVIDANQGLKMIPDI